MSQWDGTCQANLPETETKIASQFAPEAMDGWKIKSPFWDGLFSGVMLVSGRVRPIAVKMLKWEDDCFLFGMASWQVRTASFRECIFCCAGLERIVFFALDIFEWCEEYLQVE